MLSKLFHEKHYLVIISNMTKTEMAGTLMNTMNLKMCSKRYFASDN
jgi:hypothetical protein